jgi:DNA helicase-2/ATP-dependent DNA helicase PcrA
MPIVYARTPEAIEEERRLLYVGVTRARRHLVLSWAPARFADGVPGAGSGTATARTRQQSRFVAGIGRSRFA